MYQLTDLKSKALSALEALIAIQHKDAQRSFSPYLTMALPLPPMDISTLALFVKCDVFCLYKNRESQLEFLALDTLYKAPSLGVGEEKLEGNAHLRLLGAERFDTARPIGPEWSDFGDSFYFIPVVEFVRHKGDTTLHVNYPSSIINSSQERSEYMLKVSDLLDVWQKPRWPLEKLSSTAFPDELEWRKSVEFCLDQIHEQTVDKVVLARKQILEHRQAVLPTDLLEKFKDRAENSYLFYLQVAMGTAFMSLSPERLFKARGSSIETEAVAGTRARGDDVLHDIQLETELLNSPKDLREQAIVTKVLEDKLALLCQSIEYKTEREILKQAHVQHLCTRLMGTLKEKSPASKLVALLHPTPAVGGVPGRSALETIRTREDFDRGLYAAPFGYITAKEAEFGVGIRSALVKDKEIHLYGGAGIVPGSQWKDEWIEIDNKMKNFQALL